MNNITYGVSRIRRAFVHFIGGRAVQALARAILVLVLVRILPVDDYGAYMLIVGLSELMLLVASFGIVPIAQRYLPQMVVSLSQVRVKRFVSSLILAQFCILVLIVSLIWIYWQHIAPFMGFSERQAEAGLPAVLLMFLVPVFRFVAELLEALLEQGRAQVARALMPAGRVIAIGIIIAAMGQVDFYTLLWLDVGVTTLCVILAWFFLAQSIKSLPQENFKGEIPLKEIGRFGWHMAAVSIMSSAAHPGAIRLALANVLGVIESGLFAFLQSLERMISRYLPGTLLRGIIRPVLVVKSQTTQGMKTVEAGTGLLFKTNLFIISAGAIVVGVGGNTLVAWLSGDKFTEAGLTLFLMFLAMGVIAQRAVIEMILQITGQTEILRLTSMMAPLALLTVWLLASHGLNVVVIIIAIFTSLSNWLALRVLIRRPGGFFLDWKGMVSILIPGSLAIIAGLIINIETHAIISIVVAELLFLACVKVLRPINHDEIILIERVAGGRVTKLIRGFARQTVST